MMDDGIKTDHDINMEVVDLSRSLPTEMTKGTGTKYRLPQDQLERLTSTMLKASQEEAWAYHLNKSSSNFDPKLWRGLCLNILSALTAALDATDLRGTVLTNLQRDHIYRLIDGCNDEERDDMTDGVRKGIIENDWAALIKHRMYHL
jgi:hypothetical protein